MNQHEPMTLSQAAAVVISEKVEDRGWDNSEAARRAGRDRVKVWRMLTGVTKKIDLDTFDGLARALGMDPEDLMREIRLYRESLDPQAIGDAALAQLPPESQAAIRKVQADLRPRFDSPEHRRTSGG